MFMLKRSCIALERAKSFLDYFPMLIIDGIADPNSTNTFCLIHIYTALFGWYPNASCLMQMHLQQFFQLRITILLRAGTTYSSLHTLLRHGTQPGAQIKSLIVAAKLFSAACQMDLFFPNFITMLYADIIHLEYFFKGSKNLNKQFHWLVFTRVLQVQLLQTFTFMFTALQRLSGNAFKIRTMRRSIKQCL